MERLVPDESLNLIQSSNTSRRPESACSKRTGNCPHGEVSRGLSRVKSGTRWPRKVVDLDLPTAPEGCFGE